MPVNYALSKVYKIVDLTTNECFIGSTCEPSLARRLTGHVRKFKQYRAGKSNYVSSFKILEGENYNIELIEAFPCNNKDELQARVGHWIRSTNCVNKIIPNRDWKEYQENNKDKIREQKREYYKQNKDNISAYMKEYCKNNKDKRKEYRKNNRDKISAYNSRLCICPCGTSYTANNKLKHLRTSKHQQFEIDYEAYILSEDPSLDQLIDFMKNRNDHNHFLQQFENVLWNE
jgi:hypothetical protein